MTNNQCTCGFPDTKGMTHRLGDPCLITDGGAMLDRGMVVVPVTDTAYQGQALRYGLDFGDGPMVVESLNVLANMDLTKMDPQYLDVAQREIVQRAQDMAAGFEQRIANLGKVIQNLSASRDKLVQLRAKVDTVINEVEAVMEQSTSETAKQNFRIITTFLRSAADAAAD